MVILRALATLSPFRETRRSLRRTRYPLDSGAVKPRSHRVHRCDRVEPLHPQGALTVEPVLDGQAGNTGEVADIAGDQRQVMGEGDRGDAEVGLCEGLSVRLELGA
jgi:hypothetical protein